jgi:hypothetical protein
VDSHLQPQLPGLRPRRLLLDWNSQLFKETQAQIFQHRGLGADEFAFDLGAGNGVEQGLQDGFEGTVVPQAGPLEEGGEGVAPSSGVIQLNGRKRVLLTSRTTKAPVNRADSWANKSLKRGIFKARSATSKRKRMTP